MNEEDAKSRYKYLAIQSIVLIKERRRNREQIAFLRKEAQRFKIWADSLELHREKTQNMIERNVGEQNCLKQLIVDFEDWSKVLPSPRF